MKTLALTLVVVSLAFCLGCGSGNNNTGGGCPTSVGNFSNASLSGQYAYQLKGFDLLNGSEFREIGSFTADGAGHITGGSDDFADYAGVGFSPTAILNTSTYSISSDGTATASLFFSDGSTITLGMTLASASKVYLVGFDSSGFTTAAGVAEKQNAAAFGSAPSGTFAFRMHMDTNGVFNSGGSTSSVGVFTITNGLASGSEDVSEGGVTSQRTITAGSFNAPDLNGRGTGTLTDSALNTSSFVYYVVDANNIRFLSLDPEILGLGSAEMQTGGPFNAGSLSGGYAFGVTGDTPTSVGNLRAVGRLTSDGGGNLTAGQLDAVVDSTANSNISFTGTYPSVNGTTGRAPVSLTGGVLSNAVLYLVNPSRAFVLVTDAGTVAEGTVDLQGSSSFTNASVDGQFAFLMDGFNSTDFIDRVATLDWDGSGTLNLNELVNVSGFVNVPGCLAGTYSVDANGLGRTKGTINSLSNNLVFYLVNGSNAYVLQNDSGTQIDGMTTKQQ
ncbi:MAG TPA: hypothetical protein VMT28_13975 [Terriglobales bacterium]|jgi:hypothetical protein|nr:hypothetical protein [Terriglobales bacterium]